MKRLKLLLMIIMAASLFAVDAAAQSTTFTYPANPEDCIELKPTFEWEYTGPNTVSVYTLQVSEASDFSSLLIDKGDLTESQYTVTVPFEYNKTYYWRTITEFVPSGSEISTTATFTTVQAPPTLTYPAKGQSCLPLNNIIFTWQDLGADQYEIEIATANTFGAATLPGYPVTETGSSHTFSTGPFTKNTVYYWRVRADFGAPCNWTIWSDTLSFRTESDPPDLAGPPNSTECVYANSRFWWDPVPGATSYDIEFATSAVYGDDIVYSRQNWSSNTFTMPNNVLSAYTDYWWHVKANFSSTCETDWSADWRFKTSQFPPVFVYPKDNEKGVLLNPEIVWEVDDAIDLPETFHLQISRDANFSNLLFDDAAIPSATISSNTYTLESPPLEYNTEYWMRIRAQYGAPDNCQTDWSPGIKIKSTFPQAVGKAPQDGDECVELTYDFQWFGVPEASTFRLQVSRNEDMSEPEIDLANIDNDHKTITLQDGMAKYYWRVRAENGTTWGIWSPVWSFTTTNNAPAPIEPEKNATGVPLNVTFVWESLADDAVYEFKLSKFQNMDEPIVSRTGLTSNTFTTTVPDYFQKYYWSVKGTGNGCTSDWSTPVAFTTAIPAPTLIEPPDYAVKQPLLPTFTWDESPTTGVEYEFQLATSDVFNDLVDGRKNIPVNATSSAVKLNINTMYFWRVRAYTGAGTSAWSKVFRFTTGEEGPDVPIQVAPEDKSENTETTLNLRWHTSERATKYILQLSNTETFSVNIYDIGEEQNLTDTVYEVTQLENSRQYYWRVAAVNEFGTSAWSDIWEFKTKGAPPVDAPNLITPPKNSSSVPIPVTFSWDPVTNAARYELQLTTNSQTFTDADIIVNPIINAPKTSFVYSDLDMETDYYWRVRAINNSGNGPWSETWPFKTSAVSVKESPADIYRVTIAPNPSSGDTRIGFNMPAAANVTIEVYDLLGEKLNVMQEGVLDAGEYSLPWNSTGLNNGVYLFVIKIGDFRILKQVILTR